MPRARPARHRSSSTRCEDARTILIVGRTAAMLVVRKDMPVSNPVELAALMSPRSGIRDEPPDS